LFLTFFNPLITDHFIVICALANPHFLRHPVSRACWLVAMGAAIE
jgi:hypothetical protein